MSQVAKISVVTAVYRSSAYLEEFHARHIKCLEELGVDYEFIFVNDGSPDDSADVLQRMMQAHQRITVVTFSRNFGQYPAMFAGMAHATGDYILALDCDLEEEPENAVMMFEMMRKDPSIDVVYGVIEKRTGGMIRDFCGRIFFVLLKALSEVQIPPNQGWQRIMTRQYVQSLLRYTEVETLPAGLMMLTGFKQVPVSIRKEYKGTTSYSLRKRIRLALNSITAFSSRPLVYVGIAGMSISAVACVFILIIAVKKLFFVDYQAGWSSLIASVWLVGGLILASLGLVGIYLAKVFNQVKGRPLYIVRSVEESRSRALQ